MKVIEEELGKITPLKRGEFQGKRMLRGDAAEESAATGGKVASLDDAMPREDISKKITSKLVEQYKHKDWKERKKAGDTVEAIIKDAKCRILPSGLTELMDCVKQRLTDANKGIQRQTIQLLGLIVEALGPAASKITKKLLPI